MLHNYILRQAIWPLLAAIGALGLLALLTQSISTLDLIIDQRQTLFTYLEITALALPQLLALIVPLGVFVATLYAMNRMQNDAELIVCSAAGMGRWQIAAPVVKLAIVALLANLAINMWLQPMSFSHMRVKLFEVRADLAAKLIRPGEFYQPAPGLVIYVKESQGGTRMTDLFIKDQTDPGEARIYSAKYGEFTEVSSDVGPKLAINLRDTTTQIVRRGEPPIFGQSDESTFLLDDFLESPGSVHFKLSDRYVHQLLFPDWNEPWDWLNLGALQAEGHYRLSSPLYNLAFALIALAAVLGGQFSRMGYTRRIVIASVTALLVRLTGFAVQGAAADDPSLNILQYAVPLTTSAGALLLLVKPSGRLKRAKKAATP